PLPAPPARVRSPSSVAGGSSAGSSVSTDRITPWAGGGGGGKPIRFLYGGASCARTGPVARRTTRSATAQRSILILLKGGARCCRTTWHFLQPASGFCNDAADTAVPGR